MSLALFPALIYSQQLAMTTAMFFQDLFCGCRPGEHIRERNEKRRHVRVVEHPSHPLANAPLEMVQSSKQ